MAAVLFIGINAVSARVRVDGFSMRPTLEDGEFVLVSRMSYKFSEYERGDIVVFHFPLDPKEELIKRVIGLPGDHVRVEGGQVFLNGQLLEETYIAEVAALLRRVGCDGRLSLCAGRQPQQLEQLEGLGFAAAGKRGG